MWSRATQHMQKEERFAGRVVLGHLCSPVDVGSVFVHGSVVARGSCAVWRGRASARAVATLMSLCLTALSLGHGLLSGWHGPRHYGTTLAMIELESRHENRVGHAHATVTRQFHGQFVSVTCHPDHVWLLISGSDTATN
jgi:hypothetical protein